MLLIAYFINSFLLIANRLLLRDQKCNGFFQDLIVNKNVCLRLFERSDHKSGEPSRAVHIAFPERRKGVVRTPEKDIIKQQYLKYANL